MTLPRLVSSNENEVVYAFPCSAEITQSKANVTYEIDLHSDVSPEGAWFLIQRGMKEQLDNVANRVAKTGASDCESKARKGCDTEMRRWSSSDIAYGEGFGGGGLERGFAIARTEVCRLKGFKGSVRTHIGDNDWETLYTYAVELFGKSAKKRVMAYIETKLVDM